MNVNQVFNINSPNIVSETIDGEVVVVNLQSGDYYSLLNTAADVWNKIEQGIDSNTIIADMESSYESSSVSIKDAVNSFLEKLQIEGLIVANGNPDKEETELLSESSSVTEKKPFSNPIFEKFTDMEDLLLLDPIHEVDEEEGWPKTK